MSYFVAFTKMSHLKSSNAQNLAHAPFIGHPCPAGRISGYCNETRREKWEHAGTLHLGS